MQIEAILSKRHKGNLQEYLVKWSGFSNKCPPHYPESVYTPDLLLGGRHNTWESEKTLQGCIERVRAFEASEALKRKEQRARSKAPRGAAARAPKRVREEYEEEEEEEEEEETEPPVLGEIASCLLTPAGTKASAIPTLYDQIRIVSVDVAEGVVQVV